MKKSLLISSLALVAASIAHADLVVDFNSDTVGNAPSNFNFNVATSGMYTVVAGGLNGSNAVQVNGTTDDGTMLYNPNPAFTLDTTSSDPITLSVYFKSKTGSGSNAGSTANFLQLALLGNFDQAINGGSREMISMRLRNNGTVDGQACTGSTTTQATFTGQSGPGGVGTDGKLLSAGGTAFSLTPGNWYDFSVTFTRSLTANQFNLSTSLFNSDSNGNLGTAVFSGLTTTLTQANLYGDTTAFAALRAQNNTLATGSAVDVLDNFQVPEPSTYAMVGLGAMALVGFRRRKLA